MIEKIIEFSAKNKYIVIIFVAAAIVGAIYAIRNVPLDAIPDLSDTQVIIYSRWDRSPDVIEDQVTYPIVSAMLGAPKLKAGRGHGVPVCGPRRGAARGEDGDRARRHGARVDLPVRARGRERQARPGRA